MSNRSKTLVDIDYSSVLAKVYASRTKSAGVTVAEIAAAVGHSPRWVRERLIQTGVLRHNGTRSGVRIDGLPCLLPVYVVA